MKKQEIEVYILYNLNYIKEIYLEKLKRKFDKMTCLYGKIEGWFPLLFTNFSSVNKNGFL